MAVTKNLHSALLHLRLENRVRILWIDAMCINQADVREREQQVGLMGSIYSQASLVVVWLGEAWSGSDLAMKFIQQSAQDTNLHLGQLFSPVRVEDQISLDTSELWEILTFLFDLPWWKRVWTIQEFVLAQHVIVQCGKCLLDGGLLLKFMEHIERHGLTCCKGPLVSKSNTSGLSVTDISLIIHHLVYAREQRGTVSFLDLLAHFREWRATDPRDKLYAMLGLTSSTTVDLIRPDYISSCEQVFEAATVEMANHSGRLNVFSHLFGQRNLDLPHIPLYNSCTNVTAELKLVGSGQASTKAILLDQIVANTERVADMKNVAMVAGDTNEKYPFTGESIHMAFWLTTCGGIEIFEKDSLRCSRRTRQVTGVSIFESWLAGVEKFATISADSDALLTDPISVVYHAIGSNVVDRKFARTKAGYIGFVPEICEDGDIIALLAGGPVPYVLRPEINGNMIRGGPHYRILGDSYIYGIMDGDIFEKFNEEDRPEWSTIVLV